MDVLITLGDYVDRGPDSRGVLERLIALQARTRLVPLRGNHDLMMVDAREGAEPFEGWVRCGGRQTLESYQASSWVSLDTSVPEKHWRFLQDDCLRYHESDTHVFAHANLNPNLPLADQPDSILFWESLDPGWWQPHQSGKVMVCGHTLQRSGRPLVLDRAVCIDTWAYGEGWLTCLDVELEVYWQANQRGETRMGNLRFRARR